MSFKFLFSPNENTDWRSLHQGDILVRSAALASALSDAHKYYAEAYDYTHFMVLTQSCDLVRRKGSPPKSRYITLAAMRPLKLVVSRLVEKYKRTRGIEFPIAVCDKDRELIITQTLERLLHNTESGFFLIRSDGHDRIDEDLCVFLPLSIAIRIDHYDSCLDSKIAQLDNIFQAKVGWLAGNLYSRVGTPDIEETLDEPDAYKKAFFESVLYSQTAWLTKEQISLLKNAVTDWKGLNTDAEITEEIAHDLVARLPAPYNIAVSRIASLLQSEGLITENDLLGKIERTLLNDLVLLKLMRAVR